MMLLLASVTGVSAADGTLSVQNFRNVIKGYSGSFDIVLSGSDVQYAGYQFSLTLPSGLTYSNYADGPMISTHSTTVTGDATKKFTGAANPTANFTAMNGVLVTIYFTVSNDYDPNQSNLTISGIHMSEANSEDHALSDYVVSVPLSAGVTLDENDGSAPAAISNVNVTVNRTLKADVWNTICLPFALDAGQISAAFGAGTQVAAFAGATYEYAGPVATSIQIQFSTVTAMAANTPYIIKVPAALTSITVNGTSIENPTNALTVAVNNAYDQDKFIGTYVKTMTIPDKCLYLSNNQFKYSGGNATLKKYRAYFNLSFTLNGYNTNGARGVSFDIDGTTSLNDVKSQKEEVRGEVFNLQGQRVAQPTKGVYIVNGRKVVVK